MEEMKKANVAPADKPMKKVDHLFQCPKRPAYRKKILEALNTIKKGMCPTLYYLFSNSILNYRLEHT